MGVGQVVEPGIEVHRQLQITPVAGIALRKEQILRPADVPGVDLLQPENPVYEPKLVPLSDFETGAARIVGVAVRLVREL